MNRPHGTARRHAGATLSAASVGGLLALCLALGAPTPASAQEGGPLLKSDLVRMMTASNYTPTEMAAIVRMNCLGFEPTARDRNQLGSLPNADIVLAEVERCASRPRADRVAEAEPEEVEVERAPPPPRRRGIDLGNLDIAGADAPTPKLDRPKPRLETGGASAVAAGGAAGAREVRGSADFDTPPELTNWKDVSSAFLREYRPNVRQPGTVLLWLRVGPEGRVLESRVTRATGDPVMADAALRVTELMQFKPATRDGRNVESWTELPINFSSKR